MQILAVQFDIAWEDPPANYAKVRAMLRANPPRPGALVCLPEMCATGFSMNTDLVAESEPRATEKFLSETAQEFNAFVLGGLASRGGDGCVRNECVVFDSTGLLIARYGKLHPFTPGGESSCYTKGGEVTTFRWGDFIVAPF